MLDFAAFLVGAFHVKKCSIESQYFCSKHMKNLTISCFRLIIVQMKEANQPNAVNSFVQVSVGHTVYFYAQPSDLKPSVSIPPRTPAIFNSDGSIHRDATTYLYSLTGMCRPGTWRVYAYSLAGWLDFLAYSGRDYLRASQQDLEMFRDIHAQGSAKTGEAFSGGTIGLRMIVAIKFCQFLAARGDYVGDILSGDYQRPSKSRAPIDSDLLAHTRTGEGRSGGYAAVPRAKASRPIRPLTYDELRALQEAAGEPRTRDRLVVDIAWKTGLRRQEIADLDYLQFINVLLTGDPEAVHPIEVIGKGSKARNVLFDEELVADIQHYIANDRLFATRARSVARDGERALLVTNAATRNGQPGRRLSANRLWEVVQNSSVKAGLTLEKHFEGKVVVEARVSPHDLRHTFAVMCLAGFMANNKTEDGLLHIQQLLGHAHYSTTRNVYLKEAGIWLRRVRASQRPDGYQHVRLPGQFMRRGR
ncbi:MAG: tyrosine-type recombinase/integrase [Magnetospirillum sp.]|nr:tyrosine-type recombinase/integrase [Magnetospirillum sp.]